MHLHEVAGRAVLFHLLSHRVPIPPVRADECGERHESGRGEQFSYGADAADVLPAILGGEAESEPRRVGRALGQQSFGAGIESVPNVVSVEQEAVDTQLMQSAVHRIGDRALAAATQSRKPHHTAAVAVQGLPLQAADLMWMPGDVHVLAHAPCFLHVLHGWMPARSRRTA